METNRKKKERKTELAESASVLHSRFRTKSKLFVAALAAAFIATCATHAGETADPSLTKAAPEAWGFNAPTLEGHWRFRLSSNAWMPDVPIHVEAGGRSGSTTLSLSYILHHLKFITEPDVEVRKGTFGFYVHSIGFKLTGAVDVGPATLNYNDAGFLMDVGFSYELGRWKLGKGTGAPVLTVEPFAGARLMYDPVDLNVNVGQASASTTIDFWTSYSPDIGIRAFVDLTEHWNLRIEGDYGGFGVDHNYQSWQAVGLIGYRWRWFKGTQLNLQAGYRAMRIEDLKKRGVEGKLDAHGPTVVLSAEF